MKKILVYAASLALALAVLPALAGQSAPSAPPSSAEHGQAQSSQAAKSSQSVTHGSVTVGGKPIGYNAIAGVQVLKKQGKPYVSMSYVAYIKKDVKDTSHRPITFFYNGGPGSSTVWLHMLAFGPKRVVVGNGTLTPPAPYKMVNNDNSLLDATDMVFIDAPGTGFGRVIGKDQGGIGTPDMVYGVDADAKTFANFIEKYITKHSRWNSPKFLFGESYGTTRDAVLANDLTQASVNLNGVVFLSAVLNWSLMLDLPKVEPGISLAYATGLPSMAATAWYHKKLPHRSEKLKPFLKKVEQFAMGDYLHALNKGNLLDAATKKQVAQQMHAYTGLPTAYILKANLRVDGGEFAHELLTDEDDVTGRLDSRFSGPALDPLSQNAGYDPMDSAIDAPTVSMFNDYIRNTLDFGQGRVYKPQINVFMKWNFKHKPPGVPFALPVTPNVMPDIAAAMKHNPNMKLMLAGGYFDLGTPFYAAQYEMHQLTIPPKLQKNISYHFFKSGHMVYLNPDAHKGLHDAAAKFIENNSKAH